MAYGLGSCGLGFCGQGRSPGLLCRTSSPGLLCRTSSPGLLRCRTGFCERSLDDSAVAPPAGNPCRADVQGLAAGSLCGDRTRSPAAGPGGRRRTRTARQRAVRCADRARADAAPSSGLVAGHVLSRAKDEASSARAHLVLQGDREG